MSLRKDIHSKREAGRFKFPSYHRVKQAIFAGLGIGLLYVTIQADNFANSKASEHTPHTPNHQTTYVGEDDVESRIGTAYVAGPLLPSVPDPEILKLKPAEKVASPEVTVHRPLIVFDRADLDALVKKASEQAVLHADERQIAVFYGGYKTWGGLAINDQTGEYNLSVTAVAEEFTAKCENLSLQAGKSIRCQADLIAYTPDSLFVYSTQELAQNIINAGGEVYIDFRSGGLKNGIDDPDSFSKFLKEVFSGKTNLLTADFLRNNKVGLSIDPEAWVENGYPYITAKQLNGFCDAYLEGLESIGAQGLSCRVYDMGVNPSLVADPENFNNPIGEIIHMGIGSSEKKKQSIDKFRTRYTVPVGCMVFTESHLSGPSRDTVNDPVEFLLNNCTDTTWAFQ